MAVARQILVNPANKNQQYVFYTNGFMQASGGAIVPEFQPPAGVFGDTWNASGGPPLWTTGDYARACQVIDWTIPRGYTIDMFGFVFPWGGASPVAGATAPYTGGPEYLFGSNGGFSIPQYGFVMDFMMDPGNTGVGYMLLANGDVWPIGTGVPAISHFPYTVITLARQMVMDWTSKRYWVLDQLGRIKGFNGGNDPTITDPPALFGAALTYPSYTARRALNWYMGNFALYDLSANPKGWFLNEYGEVYKVGAAQDATGYESTVYVQQWAGLAIVDDGTGGNPLRLRQMTAQGRVKEFVVSTAPVAAVTEPTGTFAAANKPWIGWQYLDREGDAQAGYEVRVATSAAYLSGSVDEVQTIASSGAPTGGVFQFGFQRSANAPIAVTVDIARNASAATVQAALEALPNIGTGGVVCAGGPLGTAAITVSFKNQMAGWGWPLLSLYKNGLTGGVSPTITRTMTTAGSGPSPAGVVNDFSQIGNDASTRIRSAAALDNNTTYRAFVRATDSSGLTGPWDFSQFNTAFTDIPAPSLTVTPLGGLGGTRIDILGLQQTEIVGWYGYQNSFAVTLPGYTVNPQGYSFKTHGIADWDWTDDQAFYLSSLMSDGSIIVPGTPATFNAFQPTGKTLQYGQLTNPKGPLKRTVVPTTKGVLSPVHGNVGGADFEDSQQYWTSSGEELCLLTVGVNQHDWSLATNGIYPVLVVLKRNPLTGLWEYDPTRSRTPDQLLASNPTAATDIFYPGLTGVTLEPIIANRNMNEICRMPRSGHLIIGHYGDYTAQGYRSGAITAYEPDNLNLMGSFRCPNAEYPVGNPVAMFPRTMSATRKESATLGNEGFNVGYDCFDNSGTPKPAGVLLDGSAGTYVSTGDIAAWTLAAGHTLRIAIHLKCGATLNPATDQLLVGQWENTGNQRAWGLFLNAGGLLSFRASVDGTAITVNVPSTALGLTPYSENFLGLEYNMSSGAYAFYKANGGQNYPTYWTGWTPINSGTTTATTFWNSNAALSIGATGSFANSRFTGQVMKAQIQDNGTVIANPNFSFDGTATVGQVGTPTSTMTDSTGKVWTLRGAAVIASSAQFMQQEFGYNNATGAIFGKSQPYMASNMRPEQSMYDELGNLLVFQTFSGLYNGLTAVYEKVAGQRATIGTCPPAVGSPWLTGPTPVATTTENGNTITPTQFIGAAVGALTPGGDWDNINKVAYFGTGTSGLLAIQRSGSSSPYTWTYRDKAGLYSDDTPHPHLMRPLVDNARGIVWLPIGQGYTGTYPPTPPLGITQNDIVGVRMGFWTSPTASLPVGTKFAVQFQDVDSDNWYNVRGGDAITPDASSNGTVVDYEAPFGKSRMYRSTAYTYDAASDLWQQSAWSGGIPGVLGPTTMWAMTNPFDPTSGLIAKLQSFETVQPVVTSKDFAVGRADPIMMSDGVPKFPNLELDFWSFNSTERAQLEAMCNANVTLLLRNFYGESFYIRLDSEFRRTYLRASPLLSEATPLRDAKSIKVTTQAVKRPVAGPTTGPLAEV